MHISIHIYIFRYVYMYVWIYKASELRTGAPAITKVLC